MERTGKNEKILIIIPAYNEEGRIGRVTRGLFEHGFNGVLVVDDGSDDATARQAVLAGARVLRHAINRGQGAALETGDEYARRRDFEMVAHFDADGQFNPADLAGAAGKIAAGECDAVLGSRFLDGRSRIPFVKKFFIFPVARVVNFLFTGLWLSDAHNGFRVFNKRALEKIRITQNGMAHNTEIVRQIKKHGLKFCEYPVEVKYHEYGQGIRAGARIVKDLLLDKMTNF